MRPFAQWRRIFQVRFPHNSSSSGNFFGYNVPATPAFIRSISVCVRCFGLCDGLWPIWSSISFSCVNIKTTLYTRRRFPQINHKESYLLSSRGFNIWVFSSALTERHKDTSWRPMAWFAMAAASVTNWSKRHKCGKSLESTRNNTSEFLIWTHLLPSSNACSNNSWLQPRLWKASGTSCWGPPANSTGLPVTTMPHPLHLPINPHDSQDIVASGKLRSKFGIACKVTEN